MTILRALPAPVGATLVDVKDAVLKLPATEFDRIAPENPAVLRLDENNDAKKEAERKVVVQIVAAFLVLLWVATRKRTF